MKKLILAACVAALGVPVYAQAPAPQAQPPIENGNAVVGGGVAVQQPAQPAENTLVQQQVQQPAPAPQPAPNVDYGYYGGPSAPKSQAPPVRNYGKSRYYGFYKLYGVPDDLTIAEQERDHVRYAAVEFGRFRRQFTGSTQFWMDEHRTELAKSRYAMDEPMWRALHPPEYFGDGGYLYNTAESVGAEVIWGPPQPILVENPRPTPLVTATPVESTVPTSSASSTSPASRNRSKVVPRVIAGEKPIYDAAASVVTPSSK